MAKPEPIMDAPIAGQSLTTEVGGRPWQQPAKYSTVEDALEFYAKKITDPAINSSLLDALEMGTPVSSVAEVIVQSSAMEGLHTIDVSILLLPVVMELIAYVADEAEIKYNMGIDTEIDQDIIPDSIIELAIKKAKDKMPEEEEEKQEEVMGLNEELPEPQPTGLMARTETEDTPMETPDAEPEATPETGSLMARRA
jgi:hypothetical protein